MVGKMNKLEKLRSRYLEDPITVRLGGLAANLSRVSSFSKNDNHLKVVSSISEESKWFIEWIAGDLKIEEIAELVKLQIQMAIWVRQSHNKWNDSNWRSELIDQTKHWSQSILQMSGLLDL